MILNGTVANDIFIAVLVTADSYIMFKLGERRANQYFKRVTENPAPIIQLVKNFIQSFKNDPELSDPRLITEMTKALLKSFKNDPEFQELMRELASSFANSVADQLRTKLPEALEEARTKSPVIDAIVRILSPQKKDNK